MAKKFELCIVGNAPSEATGRPIRYRKMHPTYEAAEEAAHISLNKIDSSARAAHPAIIYGPECGRDGRTIR
jgi:hypothetical protein